MSSRGTPLSALHEVVRAREALAALERSFVIAARLEGCSWRMIGGALGVSRQAAQQRFRPIDPRPRERDELYEEALQLARAFAEPSANTD